MEQNPASGGGLGNGESVVALETASCTAQKEPDQFLETESSDQSAASGLGKNVTDTASEVSTVQEVDQSTSCTDPATQPAPLEKNLDKMLVFDTVQGGWVLLSMVGTSTTGASSLHPAQQPTPPGQPSYQKSNLEATSSEKK